MNEWRLNYINGKQFPNIDYDDLDLTEQNQNRGRF